MLYYENTTLDQQLDAFRSDYLEKRGWVKSFESRLPIDSRGPIPWITYPALSYLETLIRPEWRIFEYGGGFSTLWWGARVAGVHTVDHNADWIEKIAQDCPPSVSARHIAEGAVEANGTTELLDRYFDEIIEPAPPDNPVFRRNSGVISESYRGYASAVGDYPPGYFDVVVIDGMARSLSTWITVQYAKPRSFILFDNSDRPEYAPAYDILLRNGYRRIDFWGPGPINPYEWCTSMFVKNLDVLP